MERLKRNALLFLILSAVCLIGCASTAPLPANITFIAPSPNISPQLSAFFGVWKGKWHSSQDVTLVIEMVDSNYADVIFSVGALAASGITPQNSFYYMRGEVISDSAIGWATANGNRFVFEMQTGSNEIKGYFVEGSTGAKVIANMVRVNVEELANVKIHKYPYVEYTHPAKSSKEFAYDNNICWREAEKETALLSPDIRRYTVWEKLDLCLRDFGWKPVKNDSQADVQL
ncbi:MAG: hypothetical protein HZB61_13555 [Nitrospirae bacterium]|nr:hypothetical protein [Nitrospirota bacterium]